MILSEEDYATLEYVGEAYGDPNPDAFDPTVPRAELFAILSDATIPYSQRLEMIADKYLDAELPDDSSVGNLLSTDVFYGESEEYVHRWADMGVLAVEMEAAALYMNAAKAGKRALAICTVSDSLVTGEGMDAVSRQESLTDMITLSLDVAVSAS